MNNLDLVSFYENTSRVEGWLSFHDVAVFDSILSQQVSARIEGDLLEIGVYAGKSAVLLGQYQQKNEVFHVCDIFDVPTDDKNSEEILSSYENLSRKRFEANCVEFLGSLPTIHECLSRDLAMILRGNFFRFIHIDGSHLYDHVRADLNFAVESLGDSGGLIAVDDYRAQHTVGVALAVWDLVLEGVLVPRVMTPAKIYLSKPEAEFDHSFLEEKLNSLEIQYVYEEIQQNRVLRTVGLTDSQLYSGSNSLTPYLPPIFVNFIRKTYFWKKFRTFRASL